MNLKKSKRLFKASAFTVFAFCILLVGHFACQENEADEKPINGSAVSDLASTGNSSNTVSPTSPFHEGVGAQIPHDVAKRWKEAYKKAHPAAVESHFFGTAAFQRLLHQPNVVGISIEYALNDEGVPQLLLVGIDKTGRKMTATSEAGEFDASRVCPPSCGSDPTTDSN